MNLLHPPVWLYVDFPATHHEGIEDRIVFSSKRDGPDGLYHEVVVYVETSVLHIQIGFIPSI